MDEPVEKKKKLTVWATSSDIELWREAAHIRRTSLSEWVRRILTATAEDTKAKAETETQ